MTQMQLSLWNALVHRKIAMCNSNIMGGPGMWIAMAANNADCQCPTAADNTAAVAEYDRVQNQYSKTKQ